MHSSIVVSLGAVLCGSAVAHAFAPSLLELGDSDRIRALEERLSAQDATIAQQQEQIERLLAGAGADWLTESRAEEIRSLVQDVLADADTRASLLADGGGAGYDRGFFLASPDGNFKLKLNIEGQIRYIYNSSEQTGTGDEDVAGFQLRRTRLDFRGHAITPDLTYRVRINADRASGTVSLETAYIGYEITDDLNITVGQFKPAFLREEFVSGFRMLAVERTYVADYFTVDYTQGAELNYTNDWLRVFASVHDGSYAPNSEFNADRTNLGFAGRAEFLLAGDWKQFDDFTSLPGEKFAVLLGVAGGYEFGESGLAADLPNVFKWTADISAEFGGFNLFAAIVGQSFDNTTGFAGLGGADQIGFVVQGGAFVYKDKLELFGRYEWTDFDGFYYRNSGSGTQGGTGALAGNDEVSFLTFGGNYYINKHNLKLTLDAVFALDSVPVSNTGAGIVSSPDDGQVALRSQLQWSF